MTNDHSGDNRDAAAIESMRLSAQLRARDAELAEALEQQAATAEILRVISSSPTDVQPVFDAIAASAARLCGTDDVYIRRIDGGTTRRVAHVGTTPLDTEGDLRPLRLRTIAGAVARECKTIHIPDVTEPHVGERYPESLTLPGRWGVRTLLYVPLIREGAAIGMIVMRRREVRPFTDKQIELLETFAAQAVIAIENVRLFNETKDALDQQRASGEVLRVISSSVEDTKPVFEAILQGCGRLFEGRHVGINLVEEDGQIHLKAYQGPARGDFEKIFPLPLSAESGAGMAILERRVTHYPDVEAGADVPHYVRRGCEIIGIKSVIFAPMLQDGRGIGAIFVGRDFPGAFSEKEISLLKTFADQAVIAIQNVRLFKELQARNTEITESLEQQTATAEILRVISSSPTDAQPVFEAIVRSGARLFRGKSVSLRLVSGDRTELVANTDPAPRWSIPLSEEGSVTARVILRREVIQVPDIFAEPWIGEITKQRARDRGFRAIVSAPMLKEGVPIGVISVMREASGLFAEHEVALLRTFASQAVIAIENVRLFKELQARNADLTESLDRQTATAEILRVISGSPTDIQPVLDAVAESAARLCGTDDVYIRRIDGDTTQRVARVGTAPMDVAGEVRPLRLRTIAGAVARECRTIHIPDITEPHVGERYPESLNVRGGLGARTLLYVPLIREGAAIGMIVMRRREVRPFTDKQIELLETFAAQAVIAIENVRLFNETKEALEQQTVTAEILKVISSSPTDVQPVFEAIVKSGVHLFRGLNVVLRLVRGDHIEQVASTLPRDVDDDVPFEVSDRFPSSRAILHREVIQVPDVFAEQELHERVRRRAEQLGYRAVLAAPMLREDMAIGALTVTRALPGPFTDKQIALLKTFAAQAVIAIENVRLFNETKEALEQQTVISEILRVISSSPTDTQPVFDAIVKSGVHLFGGMNVSLFLAKGDHIETVASTQPVEHTGGVFPQPIGDPSRVSPRAMMRREVVQVPDMRAAEDWVNPENRQRAEQRGWRAVMSAPMLRQDKAIGTIVVTRATPGPFSDKQVELLKTFADQAVIAIENVRLFKELEARNAEVSEALKRQTATAEILEVISSSPTNVEPVFQAVAERAARICDATNARVFLVEGGNLRCAAEIGGMPGLAIGDLVPLDRGWPTGRAVIDRRIMHIEDVTALPVDEYPIARRLQSQFGHRTILVVPLMRENVALGAILLRRMEVRPFDDKQVALLQTFAAQAVIAIENARLFNEIREKSRELESANKHKSEFLANMSHELRTPLNAIIGFSEALVEKMFGEMNPKQEDYLRDIHSSGRHLLSLINDILDLSKIEAGRMELELSEFSVPMALKNAMSLVRGRAQTHGIALKLRLDPKLKEIRADERKFKQIVVNLLSNAVKFTPDGGSVQLNARLNRELLKISVKDDGIGIARADQAALFEAFRQVGKSNTGQREGTGLGLALSRRFVELHGGKIELDSRPGKGSTFTFSLPVQPGARRAARGKSLS